MLCCPITNQKKGYPFEVEVRATGGVSGVVLSDQVKSLDWVARHAEFKERLEPEALAETIGKIRALIGDE